ncbi:BCD family MFS transporter [Jiella marina]|uniref:BCD family MFS transporter n=1 Tax=Jiella sp. LLJ827 TaxID=2917712 RepID=UPI002101A142|nr:BCD family MFS transporter [Jiella sp. LLJ827]MCQ0986373.1 BCD family MFS transporter [Jiella sp. LLJ827]
MGGGLGWIQIVRLALVQTALGAMLVLTTSTMNRVMVVELALPAMLPGALVGLHHALQMLRPRFGHGSDGGRRRTPFIIAGMAVLALGAIGASGATALMGISPLLGSLAAIAAFTAIGVGVGSAGTNLLTLVATHVAEERRGPAATLIWIMMIAGFVVTTGVAGAVLDPYSPQRLIVVTTIVCAVAFLLSLLAVRGVEGHEAHLSDRRDARPKATFRVALAEVWREGPTRRFTVFIFISMLAYSAQDLVLEPFAGLTFAMTPGETTLLSSAQHGGTVVGMVLVALLGWLLASRVRGILLILCVVGCFGSAATLAALAASGAYVAVFPLRACVFALGFFNGVFAIAAIAMMMSLARQGTAGREGVRMGVWGASQAVAFGLGGFLGTVGVDVATLGLGAGNVAYQIVFAVEAALFILSAALVLRVVAARGAEVTPNSDEHLGHRAVEKVMPA